MKRVKTVSDLTRMALASGARVKLQDGATLNSDGAKVGLAPKKSPEAERVEAPQPATMLDGGLRESNERLATALSQALSLVTAQPTPVQWEFDIVRDRAGLMTKIVATPIAATKH